MAKGGQYERDLCWELSRWWSGNSKELLFWRTSNSGGGATVRRRKGIKNQAHGSDITATEISSKPFTDLIAVEAKRGYNKRANLQTLLDFKPTKKQKTPQTMYEQWFEQAITAAETSGSPFWMLIHRRDGGQPLCFIPNELLARISISVSRTQPFLWPTPLLTLKFARRTSEGTRVPTSIVCMKWRHFLFHVDPDDIRNTLKGMKQ